MQIFTYNGRCDAHFFFKYKGYEVAIKCYKNDDDFQAFATLNKEHLIDIFMCDSKGKPIKTMESILQWIDEDIRLSAEEK